MNSNELVLDESAFLGGIFNGTNEDIFINSTAHKIEWENYQILGGFLSINDKCPSNYYHRNSRCWISDANYYVQVQNKFIENYDGTRDMKAFDAHYCVLTTKTGNNSITGSDTSVPSIPIEIWHTRKDPIFIMLASGEKVSVRGNQSYAALTNTQGKWIFSVFHEDGLKLPLIHVRTSFMGPNESIAFSPYTHALHELINLSGEKLLKLSNNNSLSSSNFDLKTANATAAVISSLLKPLYYAQFEEESKKMYKRSSIWPFNSQNSSERNLENSYNGINNKVKAFKVVSKGTHSTQLMWDYPSSTSLEIYFKNNFSATHDSGFTLSRLVKRSYLGDLGRKIKTVAYSLKNFTVSVFLDIPKSLFNRTAMRNGNSTEYSQNIERSVSDATKRGIELTRDLIATIPLGNVINTRMGVNDLVAKINGSDTIIITPFTYGIELVLLGPKEANRRLITSLKGIWETLKALLSRIGITIAAIFNFVKSVFNWEDIIINHSILSAHYRKMVPFIKASISGRKGNLTSSFESTVDRLGSFTDEAFTLVSAGNFSSLPDFVSKANKEIIRNVTQNPDIKAPVDYEDIQSTFISDHIASSSLIVDIAQEDQANIVSLLADVFKEIASIGKESIKELLVHYNQLKAQLTESNWQLSKLFRVITDLLGFLVRLVLIKALQGILLAFDLMITLLDKILRMPIKIPFVVNLYQKIFKDVPSMYDIYSFCASLPVSIAFKMFNNGNNMFTYQEAQVLIATTVPEFYVENLVAFAMQRPGKSPKKLRNMYRRTVSYILGSGYAVGQLLSNSVSLVIHGSIMTYLLRAPLELVSILCNYPWSWYTEQRTNVGVNVRFLSWALQFIPFFITWPTLQSMVTRIPWLTLLINLCMAVPNLVMIASVLKEDIKLINPNSTNDGSTAFDVMVKSSGRLITTLPRVLAAYESPVNFFDILTWTSFSGAAIQAMRLVVDISTNAIYSV